MTVPTVSETAPRASGGSATDARERILGTAYDLFSREGVQTVGVDRIVADAGVAKATLYRHFRSKNALILAVLERREQLWTRSWLEQEIERRGQTPQARVLAIFDAFDEWFHRDDYEGCLFLNTLVETHDRTSSVGAEIAPRLDYVLTLVEGLAEEIGLRDPPGFARAIQLLMMGSIMAAFNGDIRAAQRARVVASLLLEHERAES
jgi:AcrR family transcriptional regulator